LSPGRDAPLRVEVSREPDGTAYLTLIGELDCCGAPAVCRAVDVAARRGTGGVLVDVAGLTFCDAAGLGVLVAAHRRLRECGRCLILVNPRPRLTRLLAVSRLEYLLGNPRTRR
jgi:anti-anti-sigma factor